jgi:hypothetical protein
VCAGARVEFAASPGRLGGGSAGAGVAALAATEAWVAVTCAACVVTERCTALSGTAADVVLVRVIAFARVTVRFGVAVETVAVSVVDVSGVIAVSVVVAGGRLSLVVGGGGVTVVTGWVLAGASCAMSGVEESAKAAAIAEAPVRAYSFMVVVIMLETTFERRLGGPIIVAWSHGGDERSCRKCLQVSALGMCAPP